MQVSELVDRGDVAAAVDLLLDMHGADVFGFLTGVLEDAADARATYRSVAMRVASELPQFQWKWSARVWLYSIARRELDERRIRATRERSGPAEMDTELWRRGDLATVINAVRRTLTEEERELLILHIDRQLDWHSLAVTRLGETASFPAIVSEARRLRARVASLLERIHDLSELHLQRR